MTRLTFLFSFVGELCVIQGRGRNWYWWSWFLAEVGQKSWPRCRPYEQGMQFTFSILANTTLTVSYTHASSEFQNLEWDDVIFLYFKQDNRIIDAPRQRKQTKRYGNEDGDFELSDLDLEEDDEAPLPRRSSWTRVECFRVEKNLLIYG